MLKKKRKYGTGKSIRKEFRVTDQIADLLKVVSENIGISENELANTAIFAYLSNSNNFVLCPSCLAEIAIKEMTAIMGEVVEMDCRKCKTKVWWDGENEKIIKSKPIAQS